MLTCTTVPILAYHGTAPDAPLVGVHDPVSRRLLEVLWTSTNYWLAAQFQDGEVRKLAITLKTPLILSEEERAQRWYGKSHAYIVDQIAADVRRGVAPHDGIIFPETVDGMEVGDVVVVLPRISETGEPCLEHAVTTLGWRRYDEAQNDWVSSPGFDA